MSYFEIAQRDDGWVTRIVGDNHEIVFSTGAQLYPTTDGALEAIAVAAQALGRDAQANAHEIRRVDERGDVGVQERILAGDRAVRQAQQALVARVAAARAAGLSWAKIGDLFGISRQAAWERFHRKVESA